MSHRYPVTSRADHDAARTVDGYEQSTRNATRPTRNFTTPTRNATRSARNFTTPARNATRSARNANASAGTATDPDGKTKGDSNTKAHLGTVVLLVRHGLTPTTGDVLPGRTPGLHLSEEGRAQAKVTAARIAALANVTAVYSSPMERTTETAAPIAAACGLIVHLVNDLNECQFGDWTGRRLADLRKLPEWVTVQRNPSVFRFPGGESFGEAQARAVGALADIAAHHRGKTVVAVSHADVIKAVVAAAVGTPLDLFQRIVISPCSVTVIVHRPSGPTVLAVNNTGDALSSLGLDRATV